MTVVERTVEVVCVGPAEYAVAIAALYGIPVLSYTHREGGLVSLKVPEKYLVDIERWYAASYGYPGDVVSYLCYRQS